jgi:hypothetical protein
MKKIVSLFFCCFSLAATAQNEGDADVIQQLGEDDLTRLEQQNDRAEAAAGAIDDAIGHFNTVMGLYNDAQDLYNASQTLSNGECSPDFSTSNNAMLPPGCSPRGECAECYRSAMGELNFVRRQLGRLGCIYQNTKNFTNSAIAFGDNASGIHAVTGLAWQQARGEIVQTMNHFKGTYDRKYIDMIGSLERALKAIDRCESQYGQAGWFQRSGFIYLEFLKDKYKRND